MSLAERYSDSLSNLSQDIKVFIETFHNEETEIVFGVVSLPNVQISQLCLYNTFL